jgi:hypothetical protein
MKVSKAEKLVCPFMSTQWGTETSGAYETTCITTNCMAWKVTKTKEEFAIEKYVEDLGYGRKEMAWRRAKLDPQDCEGYCIRLKS